jgi:hypothetical protein
MHLQAISASLCAGIAVASLAWAQSPRPLSAVIAFVGETVGSGAIWRSEPLQTRLRAMLHTDYDTIVGAFRPSDPIKGTDSVVYLTSGFDAGRTNASIWIDVGRDSIQVDVLADCGLQHYEEQAMRVGRPPDVEKALELWTDELRLCRAPSGTDAFFRRRDHELKRKLNQLKIRCESGALPKAECLQQCEALAEQERRLLADVKAHTFTDAAEGSYWTGGRLKAPSEIEGFLRTLKEKS